jgi:hypothetical protein
MVERLLPGTRLRHYKGMPYQFLFYARHSETLEELAIYECLYDNDRGTLWARPRAMFEESIAGTESMGPQPRFAPVFDTSLPRDADGHMQAVRMSGCAAPQMAGLVARQTLAHWEAIDQWESDESFDVGCAAQALEGAYAALALSRERGTALEQGRAHWLVTLMLLRLGQCVLAAHHAHENARLLEEDPQTKAVDHALALELQARLASVAGEHAGLVDEKKQLALQAFAQLDNETERARCEHFFEQGPW